MQVFEHYSLKKENTFRVDVSARYFVVVNSTEEVAEVISSPLYKNVSKLVIGEGSNILFTKDYPGLIIKMAIKGIHLVSEDDDSVTLSVGAGEKWHTFVQYAVQNNYEGIENLALIPGTVGAAPIQNIGAYGKSADETITQVRGIYLENGKAFELKNKECHFGYRTSIFKNLLAGKTVITLVTFRLYKHGSLTTTYSSRRESLEEELKKIGTPPYLPKHVAQAVVNIRTNKLPDPSRIGTAGSFFKNPTITKKQLEELLKKVPNLQTYPLDESTYNELPSSKEPIENYVKVPAGWMLEAIGWKGKRIGKVGTAENQALCVIAFDGATGEEIKNLYLTIQKDFFEHYGIMLEPEVNII